MKKRSSSLTMVITCIEMKNGGKVKKEENLVKSKNDANKFFSFSSNALIIFKDCGLCQLR